MDTVSPFRVAFSLAASALLCVVSLRAGAGEKFKDLVTRIHIEDCREAVSAARPGKVEKLEYKWRDRQLVYEFEVHGKDGVRWELECDGLAGRMIEIEREVPNSEQAEFAAKRRIGIENARRIALNQHPGTVVHTEYEIESDGSATYEFDIRMPDGRVLKLEVDASTGAVVEDGDRRFRQLGHD